MRYTIGQLAEIIDGDRGKNYPKQDEFYPQGYCLFLNTGNVTKEGLIFEENQFIMKEKDEALRKGKLKRGDIVYTTRGTVGNAGYYNSSVPYENVRINSGMVILRSNGEIVDARFLYQILKSEYYRPYFKQYCTGSAQPQLPIKNFSQIYLNVPDIKTQHRIADILSVYDDLIENNQKQIKLLEEAAQRFYKEWFVDLRFPGHENTKIVDGVPEGWKKNCAEKFFEITIGKTPPRTEKRCFTTGKNGIPWVSIADMGNSGMFVLNTAENLTDDAIKQYNVKVIPKNAVLLSFKLTVGRVAIAPNDICTNEAIAHFKGRRECEREYTYFYLKNFHYDELGSTSSISKAVNSKIIKAMPFIMPSEKLLKEYSSKTKDIFDLIICKQKMDNNLKIARDRILHKLMSGEVEV